MSCARARAWGRRLVVNQCSIRAGLGCTSIATSTQFPAALGEVGIILWEGNSTARADRLETLCLACSQILNDSQDYDQNTGTSQSDCRTIHRQQVIESDFSTIPDGVDVATDPTG
jgi:hypothetical protein